MFAFINGYSFSQEAGTDEDLSLMERLILGLRKKLDIERQNIFSKGKARLCEIPALFISLLIIVTVTNREILINFGTLEKQIVPAVSNRVICKIVIISAR